MKSSVRGIAFVAVALLHVVLIALLAMPVRRPTEETIEAPRMVMVFIDAEAHRVPNEPLQSSAPPLRLSAPAIILTPPRIEPGNAITEPPDTSPQEAPSSPSIDWNQETRSAAARIAESLETERRRKGRFAPDPRFARPAPHPEFGWDRSKTHQIESLPQGGTVIHLNDRCALVLSGLLIPVCKLGKIPARGDLFDHMGDDPPDDDRP